MGMFDYVSVDNPAFVCSEGHDLCDEEFQTKDLGETMGSATITSIISIHDGGWGETQPQPFSGVIEVYCTCTKCPAFVQAGTFNLHPVGVEFAVTIAGDVVTKVERTSATSAAQIAEAPTLDYMPDCRGPMSYAEAQRRHVERKFFPWDPTPTVDEATKERQRAWSEECDRWRRKRTAP